MMMLRLRLSSDAFVSPFDCTNLWECDPVSFCVNSFLAASAAPVKAAIEFGTQNGVSGGGIANDAT